MSRNAKLLTASILIEIENKGEASVTTILLVIKNNVMQEVVECNISCNVVSCNAGKDDG